MVSRHKTMSDLTLEEVVAKREAFRRALMDAAPTISNSIASRMKMMVAIFTQNIESRTKELQP